MNESRRASQISFAVTALAIVVAIFQDSPIAGLSFWILFLLTLPLAIFLLADHILHSFSSWDSSGWHTFEFALMVATCLFAASTFLANHYVAFLPLAFMTFINYIVSFGALVTILYLKKITVGGRGSTAALIASSVVGFLVILMLVLVFF